MNERLEFLLREALALPEAEQARIAQLLEAAVREARERAAAAVPGRWARFVERMQREAPMEGKSEEFLARVREFREHFDLRPKPTRKRSGRLTAASAGPAP